jgi:hypothetical protein
MAKMPLLIFGVLGVLSYIGLLFLYITVGCRKRETPPTNHELCFRLTRTPASS